MKNLVFCLCVLGMVAIEANAGEVAFLKNDSLFVLFVSTDCEFCHKALAYIYSDTFALTNS